ncbi:ribulose bisphosphate carboxylase/oxygenase activase,chloroplast precursor [Micromonas commoda]|uniref:Ribulose bisphosphate carboxylase/oxygenase activase, chloroplastic n=1 Tax=Micromonas commoda (strain RCC299 / NOUM17 / CCMP2709) TaxID=296587 RepID=C1E4S4_MICCC|nr:ribulose bisphosphate carboxylase/oxygenase activase,chloroplast precursor [Micromonas commoda]ACO62768.1 ribulose bisphosphate carboxylase/oxygenase activase,chloroplast precursor [Micromonas commoda]|eukprot:XP_002501510.1 ribulose bisphosphate carboxylase/oxygenase activase,chloroplast precursor [Micromonas commoda]
MSAVTMTSIVAPTAKPVGRVARHQFGAAPATFGKGNGSKTVMMSRWKGMDEDISDDQQDIARGRNMVDSKFQGGFGLGGTHNAVMSSSDYVSDGFKDVSNMTDEGYYISKGFMDRFCVHIAKNFMDLPKIKVPLILGVWGGKGQGKTFQSMLIFKKLGVGPIVMSAGELESGNAGEPAKLIRQRYREASDIIKKGRMSTLFINDLDAGAGRMGGSTQYTVNNQMVNATLMNLADNPTNVQLPGQYQVEEIPRVPIIATGNDFSTLYAPLIRDGRMEKYYWSPSFEDRVGVACGIFKADGVAEKDVEVLVRTFDGQSIDFFGALRARVYDDKVREWIRETGIEAMGPLLVNPKRGSKVTFEPPRMSLDILLQYGKALEMEQENVKRVQLADAYLDGAVLAGEGGSSNTAQSLLG